MDSMTTTEAFLLGAVWGVEGVVIVRGLVIALRSSGDRPSETVLAVRRRVRRLGCLVGRHRHKMGVSAHGGGGFGCLRCGTLRQKSNQTDPLMTDAARHVRRLFGGRA